MKVVFINCVLCNTGDAAIFEVASAVVRRALGDDVEFVVQDDQPAKVRKLYPHLCVRGSCFWHLAWTGLPSWRDFVVRRFRFARFGLGAWLARQGAHSLAAFVLTQTEREYLEGYRAADLIIATGGTYLVEHYDLGQRLFDMSMAVASGKPFILFTQSAGPFLQRRNRRLLRRIFQATRLLLLRDAQTQHHLQELGVPTGSLRIKPDAAFALADSDLLMRPIDRSPLAKTSPHVILSVRAWNYFRTGASEAGMQRYKEAFAALTMHLIEHYNAHVTFLSTCQGVEGYHDDSRLAKAIEAELPEAIQKSVIVDRSFHTPGELRELMRSGDWIVATRMHFAILALGVGAPVLPIAYEFKTSELFRSLGCDEPLSIETLTPQSLIMAFDHAVRQYGDIAGRIRTAVDGFRLDACSVADTLKTALPELAFRHSSQCGDAPSDLAFCPQSVGAVAQ